jgi:DNA processing protein
MLHITSVKKDFPRQLTDIPSPPKELFIESVKWADLVEKPMLAIVGSRKVSVYGRAVTEQLARGAAARGIVIVSGLALGVDSIAHAAALEVGGATIAVLPSGLEHIYPTTHTGLARQIIKQGGALLTEYPPHTTAAFKGNFIARNRLIAGLASVVLVTEAAEKSGSLHTANFALEQGKEVLAVPGPINSPLSAGCNSLIKTGAQMVTSVDDILQHYKLSDSPHDVRVGGANQAESAILQLIQNGIHDIDDLQQQSLLSADEFQRTLSMLEITGQITAIGGGKFTLR